MLSFNHSPYKQVRHFKFMIFSHNAHCHKNKTNYFTDYINHNITDTQSLNGLLLK